MQTTNQEINERIDAALEDGKRNELIIICLSVMIFLLGFALVVVSVARSQPVFLAPSLLLEAALYWPIRQILRIRKENIALATTPALIATLPPAQAAAQMVKLLEKIHA
jgi:hypothetical protein